MIDTNVVSELRKGRRCNPNVAHWFANVREDELFFSVLTIGEIRLGIDRIQRRDATSAASLNKWLNRLIDSFQDRILPVDRPIVEEWGRMNVQRMLPVIDSLLAATARRHGLSVVTRNVKDIARAGVDYVNPFEVQSSE